MAKALTYRELARTMTRMARLQELLAKLKSKEAFAFQQPETPTAASLLEELALHDKAVSCFNSCTSAEEQAAEYERLANENNEEPLRAQRAIVK